MSVLKLPGSSKPIAVKSIICAEGHGNYTWLHIIDQPKYLWATTLKEVEVQLPSFIRIHKSSLINPAHVTGVTLNGPHKMTIQMTDGFTMLVARRRIEGVRQQLESLV